MLFEVTNLSTVWVRVPVYVGDVDSVDRSSSARIGALDADPGAPARSARPVSAPPTADAAVVDRGSLLRAPERRRTGCGPASASA